MSTITRENYYEFYGVSNSSLSYALPESGGSYKKFTAFMAGEIGKEETPEMKLGSLIHAFMENPRGFDVAVVANMPSEAICRIIEDISRDTREELKDYAKEAISSARKFNWNKGWGDEAVAKKILTEGSEYFKALKSEKTIIASDIHEKIQSIIRELKKEHNSLIDDAEFALLNGPDWEVKKEVALTWMEDDITFKMLIDRLEKNDKLKQIVFYDYKTTSKPLSYYTGYKTSSIQGGTVSEMKIAEEYVHGSLITYHVHRQIQFYKRGLRKLFPDYEIVGRVLAVEVNAPYETKVVDISKIPVYEAHGDLLVDKALSKVKEFYAKEISF